MATALSARVVPEDGDAFDAPVSNLTPTSLFVLTEAPLSFRQALTLKVGELSLHGEVAFTCVQPPGAVVSFRTTVEALQELEDFMETLPVLVGGSEGTSLDDLRKMSDAELDSESEGDPDAPTNTEGEPVEVDDEVEGEPGRDAAAEVRKAFQRSNFPPNLSTERVGSDQLLAAKSAALARRPGDRDPTLVPQLLDVETDSGLEDMTEAGRQGLETVDATEDFREDEADENTVVPSKVAATEEAKDA